MPRLEGEVALVTGTPFRHADADHCGGDRALCGRHAGARFACHELDRRWSEQNRDLWELMQRADQRLGPYPEFMSELGASIRAHTALVG